MDNAAVVSDEVIFFLLKSAKAQGFRRGVIFGVGTMTLAMFAGMLHIILNEDDDKSETDK